ncbi:hypothetical protein ES703_53551 [subsurface metagenome]
MAIPEFSSSNFTRILGQSLNEPGGDELTGPGESGTEYLDQPSGEAAHDIQMDNVGKFMGNDRLQPLMGPSQGDIHMSEPDDNPLICRVSKSIGIIIDI